MGNPIVTTTGRVGTNPEAIGSGLRFRFVTNDRGKDESGNWVDKDTTWWTVKVWGKLAEKAKNNLKTGQTVTIVGKIKDSAWTDSQGNKRIDKDLVADEISISLFSLDNLSFEQTPEPMDSTDAPSMWNSADFVKTPF